MRPIIHSRGSLAIALCSAMLSGCATEPVSLEVRVSVLPTGPKITLSVAYLHTQTFRDDLRTVEPYGNRYYLTLKTGEASDRALRIAYARLFADSRDIASLDKLKEFGPGHAPIATIEPSILRLDYLNASGRMWGPYYSEIVYGFALYDRAGARVADWRVTGFGQFDMNREAAERRPDLPRGETAWMSEAPRRAIESATANFAAALERVPELIRLARNLPLAGADVPASLQATREHANENFGIEANYPGVVTLQIERARLPALPKDLIKDEPQPTFLLPVRLTLRNDGTRRLAYDPADVQWLPTGEGAPGSISPLPGRLVSALLTGRPFGMVIGVMSPGIGMLPALLAGLVSAAENERQKQELAAWTSEIERGLLTDGVLAAGSSRSGIVYFPRPPTAQDGTLVIPVVDLDNALRYTVRVMVPGK